jgi:Mg2+ and Co2+ transporter CorA
MNVFNKLSEQRADDNENGDIDPKRELRNSVNMVLPDGLMLILAILMIPIVIIPLVIVLPPSIEAFLHFVDYVIIGAFAIEYFLKAALAKNVIRHILNPWHLLDLLIIILPVFDFLQVFASGFGRTSPLLRLLRITRLIAAGGRALDRSARHKLPATSIVTEKQAIQIKVMDNTIENKYEDVPLSRISEYLNNKSHTWIDISYVSDTDFGELSKVLGVPRLVLESELVEEAYPRIDYFGTYSMIFARIADIKMPGKGTNPLFVNRAGLLVICWDQNIITLSRTKTELFDHTLEEVKKHISPGDSIVVSVLYSILKYTLEQDSRIITAIEKELIKFENMPLQKRSSGFLETSFHLRKEVNQLVPSLLHIKEILAIITTKRVPLEGFVEKHERLFDILTDQASYLYETASNARDNLQSLIDLYINTTSYETNKVMRIIAVITCLGIIPAIMGLLGSNIYGNPWNIQLWQVFSVLGMLMLGMGWIFYRLGWLKR